MTKTDKVMPFGIEDTADTSQKRLTIESIFRDFAAETTAHGIPRIIDRRKPLSKVFWLCLVVVALTIFFVQTTTLLSNYYAFNTKINLVNSEEVYFPAVTVCNLNKMKRSLLASSPRWMGFVPEDDGLSGDADQNRPTSRTYTAKMLLQEDVTPAPENKSNVNIRRKRDGEGEVDNYEYWYYDSSLTEIDESPENIPAGEYGDFVVSVVPPAPQTPTREDLKTFGHQSKDFILQCTFNKIPCNHTYFDTLQNMEYGNCFTFNGNPGKKSQRVTKIGSNFGLHLTLNIEENEYLGSFTESSGIRIMVHPADILPHPEDVGLSVSPGLSTNIGIRQVEIRRLDAPHGDCTDGKGHEYLQNDTYSYSIISCQKKCLLDKMVSTCNCVTDIYDDYSGVPFCTGKTQRKCRQSVEKLFYTNDLGCDCPAQCHEYIYNMQTTSSVWPSKQYHTELVKKLNRLGMNSSEILENVTKARENLVRLKIYFQELNYELVEQVPANTIESVLGTTGGLLGLYIGFSVITISEIFVLIYDVFAFLLMRK